MLIVRLGPLSLAFALAAACQGPSEAECQQAFAQLERIAVEGRDKGTSELGRAYLDSFKRQFLERCREEGTKEEVACILKSRTVTDLEACAKP